MSHLFTDIDYLAPAGKVEHGFVLVQNGAITYVGAEDPRLSPVWHQLGQPEAGQLNKQQPEARRLKKQQPEAARLRTHQPEKLELVAGAGRLLSPGFYNIHTHVPMTLLRGYAEGLSLNDWLYQKVFPFEDRIRPKHALAASRLAIAEMLRFGVVSFSDMYDFTAQRAQAVIESGIKANLSLGPVAFDQHTCFDELARKGEMQDAVRTWHNAAGGRLQIDFFVHSEYLSNPSLVVGVRNLAAEFGVRTHIHLSETRAEHEQAKGRRGKMTPTQYFDSLDFFSQPCTAAHCVWTEPEDWQILARRGVSVAHNPCSNAKLGSGIAPVAELVAAGVNVGLGTDGAASNNNLNLLKEAYTAALLAKARALDAQVLSPQTVFLMATENGAQSQGRLGAGRIEVGAPADLVLLDTSVPWMQPAHSPLHNLIYSAEASDVLLTMVEGEVLYLHGEWPSIDVEHAAAATSEAARGIVASLS